MLLPYFDGLLQTCGPLVVTYPHCPVSPSVARCLTGVCADRPPSTPSLFVLMKPNTSKHLLFYKRAKKGFVRKARERVREHPGFPTWHTCLSLKRGLLQATSAPGSMIAVSWQRQIRHVDRPRRLMSSEFGRSAWREATVSLREPRAQIYCKDIQIRTTGTRC